MYNRGNLAEFNNWNDLACEFEGISGAGKIGFVNGVEAPDNQRTKSYSEAIQNPNGLDDYIWIFGKYPLDDRAALSYEQIESLGWFNDGA